MDKEIVKECIRETINLVQVLNGKIHRTGKPISKKSEKRKNIVPENKESFEYMSRIIEPLTEPVISPSAFQLLAVIRELENPSYQEIVDFAGLAKGTISRALKVLIDSGALEVQKTGPFQRNKYLIR